ncbi:MAG TPA: hypothetical protein VEZ20_02865 [Allosphingosinicella sp.]|nr:hypothetical protein [Allosphingosinicella sp.]
MLVYGDRSEQVEPAAFLAELRGELSALAEAPPGLPRHGRLVAALIEAGRLQQGVADADFSECGSDRRCEAAEALGRLVHRLAQAVCASWESGFGGDIDLPQVPEAALPASADLREVEGYAFYAVYPEAYSDAARALILAGPPRVIGIRSIGTSLAAVAAATLGAPPPVTVRPIGDPFARRLSIAPDRAAEILSDPAAHYIVIDEGPGLSGSSFGAVADWLEAAGIPSERIAFLPSHGGAPGAEASAAHRARWNRVQRVPADFGPRLKDLLARWIEDSIGSLDAPLVEISGGGWRAHVYPDEAKWPAADPQGERRKFLATAGGDTWLVKFAGLGRTGAHKLERARALHAAGFAPEPRALVNGFLVERWHGGAARGRPPLEIVARYLGTRARLFPAGPARGATLAELLEMSRRNIGLALGEDAAAGLQMPLAAPMPVETDNRLDLHEWIEPEPGRWLKTDALDHHAAHDLIGCQDIAWDVAGAVVEFDLGGEEAVAFVANVAHAAGRPVDAALTAFSIIAYSAFGLGQVTLAAERSPPAERARLLAKAAAYLARLRRP